MRKGVQGGGGAEQGDLSLYKAENTHLLRKGKYHCMADLLFDWFGFSCFVELKLSTDLLIWPNPNRSNRRSAIQGILQLAECVLMTCSVTIFGDLLDIG